MPSVPVKRLSADEVGVGCLHHSPLIRASERAVRKGTWPGFPAAFRRHRLQGTLSGRHDPLGRATPERSWFLLPHCGGRHDATHLDRERLPAVVGRGMVP